MLKWNSDMAQPDIDWDGSFTLYDIVNKLGYDFQAQLGAGTYPIWDESMREWLNNEIYENFEYREIGQETAEDFFRWLRIKLNRIMPTLNPVAAFALGKESNPEDWRLIRESITKWGQTGGSSGSIVNDNTEDYTGKIANTGNTTTTSSASTSSKNSTLTSATPQVQLSGSENYMTGLNEAGAEGNSNGTEKQVNDLSQDTTTNRKFKANETSSSTNQADGDSDTKEYEGLKAELAQRWIDASPDILGVIFTGLESLFVQVW